MKELNSIDELLKVDESCAKESEVVFGELGAKRDGMRERWTSGVLRSGEMAP